MSFKANGMDLAIPPGVIIASATHTTDPNGYVIANGSERLDTGNNKYSNLINLGIGTTTTDKRYLSYKFEGNAYNTGSNLDGTLYGTATYNSSVVKRGTYSLLLNLSSYVSLPTLYLNSFRNGITFAFWVYRTSGGNQVIFNFVNGSAIVRCEFFSSSSPYSFYFTVGGTQVSYTFSTLNVWYHFAVTLTYTTNTTSVCKVYVNGTLQSTSAANKAYPTTADYYNNTIGIATGNSMVGYLDDFNIYNGVLSAGDIANLYNTGVSAVSVQPYLSYQFEQNITNTGTYLDGTLTGIATYDSSVVKIGTYSLLLNSSSYISIPFLPLLRFINGGLSIAFWFYRTTTGNANFINFTNGTSTLGIKSYSTGNLFSIHFFINSTSAECVFSSINVWNHFAVTLTYTLNNTSVCKLYANGVLQSTTSNMSYPTAGTGPYTTNTIGDDVGTSMVGYLDDFNIYNDLLTDSEVTSIYNNTYAGYSYIPPNLSAAFLRSTGSQTIVNSYTGPSSKSFQHYSIQQHNHTGSSAAHTHSTASTANTAGGDNTAGAIGMGACNSYNTEASANNSNDNNQVNVFQLYDVSFSIAPSQSITVSDNTGDSNENAPFCYGVNWLIKL